MAIRKLSKLEVVLRRKVIGVGLSLAAGLSFLAVPAGSASAETVAAETGAVAVADNGCEAWAAFPRKSGTKVVAAASGICDHVVPGILNLTAYLTRDGAYLSSTRVMKVDRYKRMLAADTIPVSDPAGLQNYCLVVTFAGGDAAEDTFWSQDTGCKRL